MGMRRGNSNSLIYFLFLQSKNQFRFKQIKFERDQTHPNLQNTKQHDHLHNHQTIIQKKKRKTSHKTSPSKHSHYPHPRTPIQNSCIHTRATFTPPPPEASIRFSRLFARHSARLARRGSPASARSHQRGRLERTARLSAATATTTAALHHHHTRRRLHHHSERAAEEPKRRRAPRFLRSESVGRNEPRALGLSVFVPSLRVATRPVACTALPVRCAGIEWNTRIGHRSAELAVFHTKVTGIVDSFSRERYRLVLEERSGRVFGRREPLLDAR